MALARYFGRKALWSLGALLIALLLNFYLPRLIPGNPVDAIVGQLARGGGAGGDQLKQIHENYMHQFGLDKPLWEQFFVYLNNLLHGNLGTSFGQYPASVNTLVAQSLPWSIAIQLPAILIGWLVGNAIGAIAAYKAGWFDRGAFLSSLFLSSMPYYCLAILLLYIVGVVMGILPIGGAYSFGLSPEFSAAFFGDAITYFWLPFWSLVLIFVGGQAVGMRSMAIYELGSDYVNYGRGLGLRDTTIVRYIFKNAMLPQITGLALSIGGMIGGALITELVFSYPGIGTLLFNAIGQNDYPVIQAVTLIITLAVLGANFAVDIAYGVIRSSYPCFSEWRPLMKAVNLTPRFWVAFGLVLFVLVVGVIGPFIVRVDPDAVVGGLYDKPHGFGQFILGTDNEGQSVISNLVYGTRTSLIVGLLAGIIASTIGLVIGIVAGYRGGVVDDILSGFTNVALAIPGIVVVILLSIAIGNRSIVTLAFVIGVTSWPWMARAVRAQASSTRTREHLDVAKLSGANFISILMWDVLPYLLSYVVMAFVLQVSGAILTESALSMLGLGPSSATSLGIMLFWALAWGSIRTGAWWAFLPPTIMLTLVAFSLLLLQSSLDEVFNPRLRRGKAAKRKKGPGPAPLPASAEPDDLPIAVSGPQFGGAGVVETPVSVSAGDRR